MIIVEIGVLLILAGIIVVQYIRKKQRDKELTYLIAKFEEIREKQSDERVKLVTEDSCIQQLIVQTNLLLDENSKNKREYKKSQEAMRKMLANVSHDVKTPLTVVLGYLEMNQLKEPSEQGAITYQKVKDVLEMMNEFFDLAKLESKDKTYPLERTNVSEVVKQVILTYYESFTKEQVKVEMELPNEVYLNSNADALSRILHNLISNSLRYGMIGKYFGLLVKQTQEYVIIEVVDHGKGIEKQYQEKVFDRLYTLEDSRSTNYQGSGLGLSITKALIETLNGTITLESIPYEKTTFRITLKK